MIGGISLRISDPDIFCSCGACVSMTRRHSSLERDADWNFQNICPHSCYVFSMAYMTFLERLKIAWQSADRSRVCRESATGIRGRESATGIREGKADTRTCARVQPHVVGRASAGRAADRFPAPGDRQHSRMKRSGLQLGSFTLGAAKFLNNSSHLNQPSKARKVW